MTEFNGYIELEEALNKTDIEAIINDMNGELKQNDSDLTIKVGYDKAHFGVVDFESKSKPKNKDIIFNEDKSLLLIMNGEVWGSNDLKKRLIRKGHIFNTDKEEEVILHAYEEYGTKCFSYFDGAYTFIIYNIIDNNVIICRDRAGQKPVYYYSSESLFMFSTQIKGLLSTKLIEKEINLLALNQYLQLTYIPAPSSIFKNISKLEPGMFLSVSKNGEVSKKEYWDVVYNNDLIYNYNECKDKLEETLITSVEEKVSEGESIGAFLSGGIDSTIIVGILDKLSKKPVNTFTLGFYDEDYDESNRAKIVSEYYNTNHHVFMLDVEDVLKELNNILIQFDEPFGDSSAIPTYIISKYASKYVDTVFTGDSGDELFAGYNKYMINYYSELYNRVPLFIRKNIIEKLIYSYPDNKSITKKARKLIENSSETGFEQRKSLMCLGFKEKEMKLLLKGKYKEDSLNFIEKHYNKYKEETDEISQTLYTDLKVVIEGDMMQKVNRMSSILPINTVTPMLSKEVIELAAKIPSDYKINGSKKKVILKDAFKDLIPDQLMNASKKGFGVPIGEWFKKELKENLLELLGKEFIEKQDIFNYDYIGKILNEHFSEEKDRTSELWTLFVFQNWYNNYFINQQC